MFPTKSQNLQHHLWAREANWKEPGRHPTPQHFRSYERNFYKSITPRLSVQNVDKPLVYLRKFTPDGNQLLAFSNDQRSLEVYQYQGVTNAAHLMENQSVECITASDHAYDSLYIRQELFAAMFMKQFSLQLIHVPRTPKHALNREFTLFLENGKYVLVAAIAGGSIFPSYETYEEYSDMYDDAELYDYTFHLIDLQSGRIVDKLIKPHDYIVLSHNHSASLYGGTLALLSTYRQSVDILELDSSGKLQSLYTVGPYGSAIDRYHIREHARMSNTVVDHNHSLPLTHMKHKILMYQYREAWAEPLPALRREKLKVFYKCFGMTEAMLLMKAQLIDSDHMLLRYERRQTQLPLHMNASNAAAISKFFKIYVFYNMTEQKIVKIYNENSTTLLHMLRNFCDEFRNVKSSQLPWPPSSPSNNIHFRATFDDALKSFAGGLPDAAVRFNPTLPISTHSFSSTPYLDYSLFNYDDRFISSLERPRVNCLEPIRFLDRNTGLVNFRVHLEVSADRRMQFDMMKSRDLVTYIFHPYEPFFISVQRFNARYCINFHIYNTKTIVVK